MVDGTIVGRGYHRQAGGPHAEVTALDAAGDRAAGGTLYVTLEPCNHHGRTPPCTEAILAAGIGRVVVGVRDPNPQVRGKGATRLRRRGVEVVSGVEEEACLDLITAFSKHTRTGRPYVTLKLAASLDGRIATSSGASRWITGEKARRAVHRWRSEVDAIMVGAETVRADDPALTSRIRGGRDPLRVIVDGRLRIPLGARVLTNGAATGTLVATVTRKTRMIETLRKQSKYAHLVRPIIQKAETLTDTNKDATGLHFAYQTAIQVSYRFRDSDPDSFDTAVDAFVMHRGWTHALATHVVAAPVIGELLVRSIRRLKDHRALVWWTVFLCFST